MTPNVRDYTTEELERLTTLSLVTCKPGEFAYANRWAPAHAKLRLEDDKVADKEGAVHVPGDGGVPCRRVRSFTDPTEIDPPQEVMLAELKRRKEPTYKVGDIVVDVTTSEWGTMRIVDIYTKGPWPYICDSLTKPHKGGAFYATQIRHATDAEKSEAQSPISNATHAGRRVRHVFNGKTGIVASTSLRAAMDAYWPSTADDEVAWVCDAGRAQGCCASQLELLHD